MKRTILLMTLVLACIGVAGAQTIDPTIILDGPGASQILGPSSFPTFMGAFTPTGTPLGNVCPSNASLSGGVPVCFDAQNQTGVHWTALSITYTFTLANGVTSLAISCMSNLFDRNNCGSGVPVTITNPPILTAADPIGTVTLFFACSAAALASTAGCGIFNFTPDPGFNSFVNYILATSDPNHAILSTTFTAVVNPVPEPGTMALLFAGIGAMVARRRLGKNCASRS